MGRRCCKGMCGLTLLEALVALGIASVLAGTALLGTAALRSRLRLNTATRQVVMDLKLARARAIAQGADYRLRFEEHAVTYRRQRRKAARAYVDDGPPISLPYGVAVMGCTGRGGAIGFRPRGYAGTFGTVTLAAGKELRRIVVDIAGRMRVR